MNSSSIDNNYIISYIYKSINERIGLFFSFFLHFLILIIAIGIPNFFEPAPIKLPNVIPIEIINVSETTSIPNEKEKIEKTETINEPQKQKKFNNSDMTEVSKVEEIPKTLEEPEQKVEKPIEELNTKEEVVILKKIKPIKEEKLEKEVVIKEKFESLPINEIKPKVKIKPKIVEKEEVIEEKDFVVKAQPKPKPEPKFSIASMLKDLRNEQSVINENIEVENEKPKENINNDNDIKSQNTQLSISEIDLLIQQLSGCWTAPAGAVIEQGMVVKISAKIKPNRKILENSLRIIDTNIPNSNSFYGPITESAMRTLLNPECIPLKLPDDKYDLWKNLTITFDHSIMKGY